MSDGLGLMNGMDLIDIIKLFVPIIVMGVVLVGFCLYRLKVDRVKFLPKWAWALIIIFINLIGGITFLLIGRERD
jgi:hypothetical protein